MADFNPYASQQAAIARQQKMADILQQQAFQPQEAGSYNGIPAALPAWGGLAKALQGYMGGKLASNAAKGEEALAATQKGDVDSDKALLTALTQVKPGYAAINNDGDYTPGKADTTGMPGLSDIAQFKTPQYQQLATNLAGQNIARQNTVADAEKAQGIAATAASNTRIYDTEAATVKAEREAEAARLKAEAEMARTNAEVQGRTDAAAAASAKKLPPAAIAKLHSDLLATAAQNKGVDGKLTRLINDFTTGDQKGFSLPQAALWNAELVSNGALGGKLSPGAAAYSQYKTDAVTLANAILQAARGTQTEGDAQRARDQIVAGGHNPEALATNFKELKRVHDLLAAATTQTMKDLEDTYNLKSDPVIDFNTLRQR